MSEPKAGAGTQSLPGSGVSPEIVPKLGGGGRNANAARRAGP
jgi:hypothetical protein